MKNSITMIRPLLIVFFSVWALGFAGESYGQCDLKFEYRIEEAGDKYKVLVNMPESPKVDNIRFRLYDLYTGAFVDEHTLNQLELNDFTEIFVGVRPSRYIIYIDVDSCQYFLGQDKGIIIGQV